MLRSTFLYRKAVKHTKHLLLCAPEKRKSIWLRERLYGQLDRLAALGNSLDDSRREKDAICSVAARPSASAILS
jgi:hypothetical protein